MCAVRRVGGSKDKVDITEEQQEEIVRLIKARLFGSARRQAARWGFLLLRHEGNPPAGTVLVYSRHDNSARHVFYTVIPVSKNEDFVVGERVVERDRDMSEYEHSTVKQGTVTSQTGAWVVVTWDKPELGGPSHMHSGELRKLLPA